MSAPILPEDHGLPKAGPLQQTVTNKLISIISNKFVIPATFSSAVRAAMKANPAEQYIYPLVNCVIILVDKLREYHGIEEEYPLSTLVYPHYAEMSEVIAAPVDIMFEVQPKPELTDHDYLDSSQETSHAQDGEYSASNGEATPVSTAEKSGSVPREIKRRSASDDSKKGKKAGKTEEPKAKEAPKLGCWRITENEAVDGHLLALLPSLLRATSAERAKKRPRERSPSPNIDQDTADFGSPPFPRPLSPTRSPPPKMILKLNSSSPTPAEDSKEQLDPLFTDNHMDVSNTDTSEACTKPATKTLSQAKRRAPRIGIAENYWSWTCARTRGDVTWIQTSGQWPEDSCARARGDIKYLRMKSKTA